MNRTKVILSIFLMLFLLLAGLVLPSFWKSQKKEASGNKGREPAKETTETNSDTPMPEYLDFDALKAFFLRQPDCFSQRAVSCLPKKSMSKKNRQASPSCRKKPATLPKQPSA